MVFNIIQRLQMLNGWCLLIVAGLLVMQQIDVTAAYTMEETCKYIKGGWIADPKDCQSYGYCENLKLKGKQKCPGGSYYNADKGVCQYTKNCRLLVGSMCQGVQDLTVFPHPDNCTEYIYCDKGVDIVISCPKGQVFNAAINECVYPTNSENSCIASSICRLVKNNVFAADPKKCGNYVACQQGTGESKQCPEIKGTQLYFNQIKDECQSEKFCVDNNDNGNTNGNGQPSQKPPEEKCATAVEFISDEATCYGYFKCTDDKKVGDWMKCPPKTHFNPDKQKCVTPYTYPCKKDRCGNMDAEFMGSVESNCKNYLNCKNNEYYYKSTDSKFIGKPCNQGFFDEFLQQCVPNNPAANNTNYKLCSIDPPPPPPSNG
ncbi:hypothetical protein DOY81_007176 [Sarcophaga bullata]|nr:hypothetical protein DOY81_007176 [Sarcophaga bullata]